MATKQILIYLYLVLSFPLIIISRLLEYHLSESFLTDLKRCLDVVDQFGETVPYQFIGVLIEAEDHRNVYHRGVDPIGITRAVWVRLTSGHTQGASTIEQQFVRVVTRRYERTIARKVREQLLAIAVVRHRSKRSIASAYLAIAYYGAGSIGLDGLRAHFGHTLRVTSAKQALRFLSQLKYPRPLKPSKHWYCEINSRCEAIWARREISTNKLLMQPFDQSPLYSQKTTCASNTHNPKR